MRRTIVIFLAILFCFLAYLEATAQEVTAHTNVTNNTHTSTAESTIAKPDISQSINFGMEIICEIEGGTIQCDRNNGSECDFTDVGHD